jgi:hypothetical protein
MQKKIIIPQANNIYFLVKIIDNMLYKKYSDRLAFVNLKITKRQYSYYYEAARFIGLMNDKKITSKARAIFKLDYSEMTSIVARLIIVKEPFSTYYLNRKNSELLDIIKNMSYLSTSTINRRASTVKSWIKWCDSILGKSEKGGL